MSSRDVSSWLPYLIGPLDLQGNGSSFAVRRGTLNFIGGVVTDNPGQNRTDIDITAPTGVFVQNQGVTLATVGQKLNFTGPGVVASGTDLQKTITISGYAPPFALATGKAPLFTASAPPAAASFTTSNTLGATITDNASAGSLLVTVPGNRAAGGDSRATAYVALPATPYTFTIGQIVQRYQATCLAGIFIGDSAGKIIELATYHNTGDGKVHLLCNKLTNKTTESAAYTDIASHVSPGAPLFLSIVDHGAGNNLDFRFSYDGVNFINFEIRARNDFLGTIDKVGLIFDDATVVSSHGTVLFEDVFHWVLA